ncbi:GIY-YIG nuclease family protein [Candidatus Shapirobacteria bacterium]|nr:GIY-YIG nuclease family protein [Candidatus Shapirobacteria bacterium]
MYYVYFLKCSDNKTYLGRTNDLKERFRRHQNGYVKATSHRRPINLLAYFAFQNKHTAFEFEQYLKTSSGRSFLIKHNLLLSK